MPSSSTPARTPRRPSPSRCPPAPLPRTKCPPAPSVPSSPPPWDPSQPGSGSSACSGKPQSSPSGPATIPSSQARKSPANDPSSAASPPQASLLHRQQMPKSPSISGKPRSPSPQSSSTQGAAGYDTSQPSLSRSPTTGADSPKVAFPPAPAIRMTCQACPCRPFQSGCRQSCGHLKHVVPHVIHRRPCGSLPSLAGAETRTPEPHGSGRLIHVASGPEGQDRRRPRRRHWIFSIEASPSDDLLLTLPEQPRERENAPQRAGKPLEGSPEASPCHENADRRLTRDWKRDRIGA